MSEIEYTYKELYGTQSLCERCYTDSCRDVGKRNMFFDGIRNICKGYEALPKRLRPPCEPEPDLYNPDKWNNVFKNLRF